MTKEEIQAEIIQIEKLYAEFEARISRIKQEEDTLVNDFLKKLEERKINEVRATLTSHS